MYVRSDNLACVVIADGDYPPRVVFTLMSKVAHTHTQQLSHSCLLATSLCVCAVLAVLIHTHTHTHTLYFWQVLEMFSSDFPQASWGQKSRYNTHTSS